MNMQNPTSDPRFDPKTTLTKNSDGSFKVTSPHIKDKPIQNFYPQLQGKVEVYNKKVKNEFTSVENISSLDEGKLRYDVFVKASK